MRENRLSGSMQGRRETAKGTDNCGQFNPFCPRPPTLLSDCAAVTRGGLAEAARLVLSLNSVGMLKGRFGCWQSCYCVPGAQIRQINLMFKHKVGRILVEMKAAQASHLRLAHATAR